MCVVGGGGSSAVFMYGLVRPFLILSWLLNDLFNVVNILNWLRKCVYYFLRILLVICLFLSVNIIAAIGGPTGELLERNAHLLNQIYTNISNMQVFPIFYVKVPGLGIQL